MSDHPIEALLRPPVEAWTAGTAAISAGICLLAPWALFMTPGVSWAAAGLFGALALYRGKQAWRIRRYQRSLRRLPRYVMGSKQIPVSDHYLFLGLGFRWDQRHTQRLNDAQRPDAQKYLAMPWHYQKIRALEYRYERARMLAWLWRYTSKDHWLNPLRPLPPVGGDPAIHAVGLLEGEGPVTLPLPERFGHTLVLGTTRVGKTREAELLITQDIRRGDVTIVFDPKGDADLMRRCYSEAKRAGRLEQFHIFHLGYPHLSARYNPVGEFGRVTEVASRISGQLPDQGNSAAFREFAWRFSNVVARALLGLGRKPDYTLIARYVTHIEPLLVEYFHWWLDREGPQNWRDGVRTLEGNDGYFKSLPMALRGRDRHALALVGYTKENGLYDPVADGLRSAFEYDKTYFDKLTSNLLPLIEKLTSGEIGQLLAPDYDDADDDRPIIDWYKIIREGGIVYVGLDALSDAEVAAAVGNSMFADLTSIAGRIYKHGLDHGLPRMKMPTRRVCIHADEFNELVGPEFVPLLNKAGGASFQVTVYTQTWADVEVRFGNKARASQVEGNLNNLIMLRVKSPETAEILTNQLKDTEIRLMTIMTAATDSSQPGSGVEFTSLTRDQITTQRVPLIHNSDLVSLPKGQAFCLINGGQLFKLRLPLPANEDDEMPEDLRAMAADMRARYRTSEQWWVDGGAQKPATSLPEVNGDAS